MYNSKKLPFKFPKKVTKVSNCVCLSQEINVNKGSQSMFQKLKHLKVLKTEFIQKFVFKYQISTCKDSIYCICNENGLILLKKFQQFSKI